MMLFDIIKTGMFLRKIGKEREEWRPVYSRYLVCMGLMLSISVTKSITDTLLLLSIGITVEIVILFLISYPFVLHAPYVQQILRWVKSLYLFHTSF